MAARSREAKRLLDVRSSGQRLTLSQRDDFLDLVGDEHLVLLDVAGEFETLLGRKRLQLAFLDHRVVVRQPLLGRSTAFAGTADGLLVVDRERADNLGNLRLILRELDAGVFETADILGVLLRNLAVLVLLAGDARQLFELLHDGRAELAEVLVEQDVVIRSVEDASVVTASELDGFIEGLGNAGHRDVEPEDFFRNGLHVDCVWFVVISAQRR